MHKFVLISFLLLPVLASSQSDKEPKHNKSTIFSYVERMPEPGFDVQQYLSENIKYPQEAVKNNIEGRVYVKFVVNAKGDLTDIHVAKSVHPLLDKEAIRAVKSMPKWEPGTQNGKAVRVYYMLPVNFKITLESDSTQQKSHQ